MSRNLILRIFLYLKHQGSQGTAPYLVLTTLLFPYIVRLSEIFTERNFAILGWWRAPPTKPFHLLREHIQLQIPQPPEHGFRRGKPILRIGF